ncbi:MAG: translation elongation factor Ts [Armatimonadota bacterium]|nr:translation elongation factor Ts [Armatimonadota bacterium]MDR7449322.1 translation elongation factor Ts [Armatimonadota bacterium]MDR7458769.1 translation elongation factor Ts [Armatimonadota bacterium]MDR7479987.1 translation elongation factor Ts [Armatimonadota bacterium]MDR7488623.1 translation elongation factor Ts [Armatimonadota bacterium]
MRTPITADAVKALRARTGAGVMDCRRALEEAGGDLERAAALLRERGLATAARKAGRATTEGLVEAYIHAGGRLGALVEVDCETDFVARTEDFRRLARELAMQVAATGPLYVSREEVPEDDRSRPDLAQLVLLEQPYIRDPRRTIGELVRETVAKVGENIQVRRFARFRVGE